MCVCIFLILTAAEEWRQCAERESDEAGLVGTVPPGQLSTAAEDLLYVRLESTLLLKITVPLISAPSDKLPENNILDIHLTGGRGVDRTVWL